jgi:predicted Zn-dependent protease
MGFFIDLNSGAMNTPLSVDNDNKNFKFWLVTVLILSGILLAGGWFARTTYENHREKKTLRQAREFFEKGDYRNASLSARQVLQRDPTNLPACRIMANLAELAQSPATLDWCRRIAEVEPTVPNKLQLAAVGLQFQNPPFPLTTQILGELPGVATNLAAFHTVSAELSIKLNRLVDAQAHLADAVKLEPTNQMLQISLASLCLSLTNQNLVNQGRATLKRFVTDTNLSSVALRALIMDRLAQNDLPGARDYSTLLLAGGRAGLSDHLQYLNILRLLHSPEMEIQLRDIQSLTATNAMAAAEVASWMSANSLANQAILWLTNLAPAIQAQSSVRLATAAGFLAESNWPALRGFTAQSEWGEADFLRQAYLAHAWSELGEPLFANSAWQGAVSQAQGRIGPLTTLLKLAGRWELKDEQQDLLWEITRSFPREQWAWRELEREYVATGNTRKLNELLFSLLPFFSGNVEIKNNLAATSLLLKTNSSQAGVWAKEVFLLNTNDPVGASTYAFALHQQGRTAEGLLVLEHLNQQLLEQPATALYYGVLLAAAGRADQASHFLHLAQADPQLLPEEKQLLLETLKANP